MSTGNIRTLRNQSGTVGNRTWGSILSSGGGGAGSFRRLYGYYQHQNQDISYFYQTLGIRRGQNLKLSRY